MPGVPHQIAPALQTIQPLASLCSMLPSNDYFLVGGCLRDALLGLPIHDLDIVACCDPTELAQQFADRHGAPWFWLDRDRRLSRVLVEHDNSCLSFDFAPLRAAELIADLAARDFTINSMALGLHSSLANDELIDPHDGLSDLHHSCLRMCGPRSFVADPLRILKGIRHAVALGFVLEEETSQAMIHNGWRLKHVAVERLRKEIWTTLAHHAAENGLQILAATGVGAIFWGEGFDDRLERLVSRLRQCRQSWCQLVQDHSVVAGWLVEDVEPDLPREVMLIWTELLSVIDPTLPASLAEDWRFSRRARARIKGVSSLSRELVAELCRLPRRPRLLTLWARKHGLDPGDLLLTAVTRCNDEQLGDLMSWIPLAGEAQQLSPVDLVDGAWLNAKLGIPFGPEVGEVMELVREQEFLGKVIDRQSAEDFLLSHWLGIAEK
ncbi:MAG: hypothetical protein C0614_14175 [Desulfuromonas sp.]|nr:MAG: hypothetical protein C0614_14175 [Desulfuromonas sp.]